MTEAIYFVDAGSEALAQRTAAYIAERTQEATRARGRARIAISGGNSPRRAFELLAEEPFRGRIDWERVEIYWVDERAVPPDSADSNYRMAREALLSKVPLKQEQIFRVRGELDAEEAAAKYESDIRGSFRLEGAQMPAFDLIALGMGPDGHTASLFPYTGALHESMRIAVANHVLSQKVAWRITLTWPVINQGRDVFFLIEGEDKAEPLHKALLGDHNPEEIPSQLVRPANGRLTLLLDRAAASLLPAPGADGRGRLELPR